MSSLGQFSFFYNYVFSWWWRGESSFKDGIDLMIPYTFTNFYNRTVCLTKRECILQNWMPLSWGIFHPLFYCPVVICKTLCTKMHSIWKRKLIFVRVSDFFSATENGVAKMAFYFFNEAKKIRKFFCIVNVTGIYFA